MLKVKRIFLLLVFFGALCAGQNSFAQLKDTSLLKNNTDSLKLYKFDETAFNNKNFLKFHKFIDTSLTGTQKYQLLNDINPFIAKFSNSGLAYRDLDFKADYNFDFVSSRQYYKNYFRFNENAQYYNVSVPFSDAFFCRGPLREQILNFLFTRKIKNNFNISVNYKLIYSPGTYLRQKTNESFFILTSNYHTKNKKYVVLGNYFFNKLKTQENGGLTNDSSFTENLESRRQLIETNLTNAENQIKESGFYIKQFYFLGFHHKNEKDTTSKHTFIGLGRISHSILFKNQSYIYLDNNPTSGFYPLVLLSNTLTYDSIHTNTIENTISWSNAEFENSEQQPFLISFGLRHKFSKLYSYLLDTSLVSIIPECKMEGRISKTTNIKLSGFYFANGYNKSDFSLTGVIYQKFKKDFYNNDKIGIRQDYFCQSPAWFDNNYSSNHFIWDYSFKQTLTNKTSVILNYKKLDVFLNFYGIKNYIYYDDYARPKQFLDNIAVVQLELNKNFKLKNWNIDNKIVYQKANNSDVLRLPDLMSNHVMYFEHPLFKNALTAQLGFEVTFFSSYYPLNYMPATREFYLQNNYKSDNYPYIDFFVNAKIKRARLYLKIDHLNSGFMGYNYFLIPHYPMSDRGLKFGISWIFYN
ncbi:MAG: putative porin [Bacteroidetes bacterium]|nr:putative porin [Bacteroidota bacterium]